MCQQTAQHPLLWPVQNQDYLLACSMLHWEERLHHLARREEDGRDRGGRREEEEVRGRRKEGKTRLKRIRRREEREREGEGGRKEVREV